MIISGEELVPRLDTQVEVAKMRFSGAVKLGSMVLMTSSVFASPPRVHRGPTAPKLFKSRMPEPKVPHTIASAEPARTPQVETPETTDAVPVAGDSANK